MKSPRFHPGDRVICSGCTKPVTYRGTVRKIIRSNLSQVLYSIYGNTERVVAHVGRMLAADPQFSKWPCYFVEPDSSPGPATFAEAQYILPGISKEQYDMLMHGRLYLVTDSDLLDEDQVKGVLS